MTTSSAASEGSPDVRQARDATGWLALAASPTFALMALTTADTAVPLRLCSAPGGFVPIDLPIDLPISGMTAMYLLMSIFHLTPWLKLAASARARASDPATEGNRP